MGEDACLENRESLIFVSIASYRDPQLVPTIADCLAKANDPEGLRFGICWQRDAADPLLPYLDDPRFRILDVDWRESRGACWARAEIQKLWQDEDWYLQVDSHCRFAQGWDEQMLRSVMQTGSAKPILSTYATGFTPSNNPGENEQLRNDPQQIAIQAFTTDGLPQLKPAPVVSLGWESRPTRGRFLCGGFLFTIADFIEEVPYDPELYFMGEESAMTVRAFTHGYDIFHPARTIVWHDYVRADARRHWGDHTDTAAVRRPWSEIDTPSRKKVQRLLRGEHVGSHGLGAVRTLAEYEAYAGVSFQKCRSQTYTTQAKEPPNPPLPPDWVDQIYPWIAKVTISRSDLQENSFSEAHMWIVSIFDDQDTEIYRRDVSSTELEALRGDEPEIIIVTEFTSGTLPKRWSLLLVSRAMGCLHTIHGHFKDDDYAILEEEDEVESA